MAAPVEVEAMRLALEAARSPVHRVSPNPRVGCVVLAGGTVVGTGHHDGAGMPHAEVAALTQAGPAARGATAVVTLEPCAHTGRTGPCAGALVAAGITRVVYGQTDPNPEAKGGAALLRGAGVDVEGDVLAEAARDLNRRWAFAVEHARPHVTWKYAASLDGRSAAADGTSQWITGDEARADVHRRRARADAVVAGTGTVVADDPLLTARTGDADTRQPLRVVVGERDLPANARVNGDEAETLHLRSRDPDLVLKRVWEREVREVLLEGGPTLAAAFLQAGLVDEIVAYLAPVLLGDGATALGPAGIDTLGAAARFTLVDVTRLGPDVRLTAVREV